MVSQINQIVCGRLSGQLESLREKHKIILEIQQYIVCQGVRVLEPDWEKSVRFKIVWKEVDAKKLRLKIGTALNEAARLLEVYRKNSKEATKKSYNLTIHFFLLFFFTFLSMLFFIILLHRCIHLIKI